jgi:uncharacterized protein YbbC (DUF1343 family)
VKTGLDNISSYKYLFRSKRVGIITNHTAYNKEGKHIVDVFQGLSRDMPNAVVTALFSPEHGLYGAEEAGKEILSRTDRVYGLPVYSLYGKTRKPTREMLEDIDILVFDIQDIGARFYTYIYTMSLAMEAAAETGKQFVVLDRPNPINGILVEGNILESRFASFVGLYPIPVRHGMTVAELATMFNAEGCLAGGVKADLFVVPMTGWRRRMWYEKTQLPFIRPSPNMPDLNTATIYPGLCLLEGTNVSEGRGTVLPFRQFGAPWINSDMLAARLDNLNLSGIQFESTCFTPDSSKYQNQKCFGVKVAITNRDALRPFFSGILIVNEIHRMYPHAFQWKEAHFDSLCGTSAIRKAITDQSSLEKLRESWQPKLRTFLQIRKKYLLYPN